MSESDVALEVSEAYRAHGLTYDPATSRGIYKELVDKLQSAGIPLHEANTEAMAIMQEVEAGRRAEQVPSVLPAAPESKPAKVPKPKPAKEPGAKEEKTRFALIPEWAIPTFMSLSDPAKRLGLCLALHRNKKSGLAWPGMETIKPMTGLGERSIFRAFDELKEVGLIWKAAGKEGKAYKNHSPRWHVFGIGTDAKSERLPETGTQPQQNA